MGGVSASSKIVGRRVVARDHPRAALAAGLGTDAAAAPGNSSELKRQLGPTRSL